MKCDYIVLYSPPGCEYQIGDPVSLDCDPEGCSDVIIDGGSCDGAYLGALSCTCE